MHHSEPNTQLASPLRRPAWWVGAAALCVASAFIGGMVVRWSSGAKAPPPSAVAERAAANGSDNAEVQALRADVKRLGHLVVAMAAQSAAAAASAAPAEPNRGPPPEWVGLPTDDDIVKLYETSARDPRKSQSVTSALETRLKKAELASTRAQVDEVDCRGETCRVRVSFADDAAPEGLLLELAALIPDSHSFQQFTPAGSGRRTVTSHYLDESTGAAPP